jgi:hypothetical protein
MALKQESVYAFKDLSQIFKQKNMPKSIDVGSFHTVDIEMFRTGKFYHAWYGDLNFDKTYLESMIRNYKAGVYPTHISFDLDHDPTKGAVGWLSESEDALSIVEKVVKNFMGQDETVHFLIGKIDLNSYGYGLVADSIYRYFSAEIHPKYKGREKVVARDEKGVDVELVQTTETPVLTGGSLTNKPFIEKMGAVMLSSNVISSNHSLEDGEFFATYEGDKSFFFASVKNKAKKNSEPEDEEDDDMDKDDVEDKSDSKVDCDCGKKECKKCSMSKKSKKEDKEYSIDEVESLKNSYIEGGEMNFSEIQSAIKDMSLADKITHLEGLAQKYSNDPSAAGIAIVLSSLKEAKRADDLASQEVQKRMKAEKDAQESEAKAISLSLQVKEAREIGYSKRVELFCEQMTRAGHFPSLVNKAKEILTDLPADNRDVKFSSLAKPESKLDLLEVIEQLFSSLPQDAKTKTLTDEVTSAAATVETKPEGVAPVVLNTPVDNKPDAKNDVPEKVKLFFSKYGKFYPNINEDKDAWSQITEDGELDFQKAISR